MNKSMNFYVNNLLIRGGLVNNTLYINNKSKDYEVASFDTSNFS